MARPVEVWVDKGCKRAEKEAGHPVKCVECPFPECFHDSTEGQL
jgi:hypothetical protein